MGNIGSIISIITILKVPSFNIDVYYDKDSKALFLKCSNVGTASIFNMNIDIYDKDDCVKLEINKINIEYLSFGETDIKQIGYCPITLSANPLQNVKLNVSFKYKRLLIPLKKSYSITKQCRVENVLN